MKRTFTIFKATCLLCVLCQTSFAQSAFQNLNFELANVPTLPPGRLEGLVSTSDGMLGWATFVGTNQATSILHNQEYLDTASVSILGPGFTNGPIFQGQYTAALEAGPDPNSGTVFDRVSATIAQTGMVPNGSRSIRITTDTFTTGLQILLAGSLVPVSDFEFGNGYKIVAGDISSFAGSNAELQITALPVPFFNGFNGIHLDNIVFSPQPVPESSTFLLIGIGAVLTGVFCRRTARRTKVARS